MAVTRLTTNGLTGTKYDIASADNYYMEPIATNLVGAGGVASIAFTNIPQGYRNLQLRWIGKDNRGANSDGINMVFNNDTTSSNYYGHRLYGDGSSAVSQNFSGYSTGWINGTSTGSVFGVCVSDILDYSLTTKYKTVRTLGGNDVNGAGEVGMYSMLWMNTAPITSITISPSNGSTLNQYSRFSLYGIKG
jgi:hypothetical protein